MCLVNVLKYMDTSHISIEFGIMLGNKKALTVQNFPAYRRQVGTMRAQFCWLIRAYHYLPPTVKGVILLAPPPIPNLFEYYIPLSGGVKLLLYNLFRSSSNSLLSLRISSPRRRDLETAGCVRFRRPATSLVFIPILLAARYEQKLGTPPYFTGPWMLVSGCWMLVLFPVSSISGRERF
jgi:hypothetical protein